MSKCVTNMTDAGMAWYRWIILLDFRWRRGWLRGGRAGGVLAPGRIRIPSDTLLCDRNMKVRTNIQITLCPPIYSIMRSTCTSVHPPIQLLERPLLCDRKVQVGLPPAYTKILRFITCARRLAQPIITKVMRQIYTTRVRLAQISNTQFSPSWSGSGYARSEIGV